MEDAAAVAVSVVVVASTMGRNSANKGSNNSSTSTSTSSNSSSTIFLKILAMYSQGQTKVSRSHPPFLGLDFSYPDSRRNEAPFRRYRRFLSYV